MKLENIKIEGIDVSDHPDYCDAFIASATQNGIELSEPELNLINTDHGFVHSEVIKTIS